ncbi:hypothetical protein A2348_02085 [Candidatus Uhrbacteria bacterium RIFOXYB12_FULL_58_10]|uniref:non-specific serine/threonine protein kinase n=1 Tax=Candidatus Uhrbacteria bacterium RIFOXYB2_FULL_57_15 TaxID=1802422 RepID=A0A1F7W6Y5_9BACT|nr:MAG: hypothetical protein A2348_02085 [Candidatus Uhrbacteria bacterium RIFOXYB12_FULL_58_10]OGL98552.1 MAG: hypothetical protein A2304_04255 [Candidatus Uhrbacteria bacterium RIFOXYB2_FULL_57_15]
MRLGPYRVIRQISEGSFGRTFYAEHATLGVPVCVKQEKTGDPEFMRLFREEARLLWDIRHSSLPTLKDYMELPDAGQIMVMSFIAGEELQSVIERRGHVADEHMCWILQRLLDALSYLHYHGVVHGDVKPANVILDIEHHDAVLVDFGLFVGRPDALTKAKGGTPLFVAPELVEGKPPIPASDIYALGATALAMAGGNLHSRATPPDMNPELAAMIRRMLRHDPLARPQDARGLNHEITTLRLAAFGRTSTREAFALRTGRKP